MYRVGQRCSVPSTQRQRPKLTFVGEQSSGIPPGQRLLASTEVLESLIGKAKQLEGQQSKSGFTKMILGIAASVANVTEQTVHTAFKTVKACDVTQWVQNHLGISIQGQRARAFPVPQSGTKPG